VRRIWRSAVEHAVGFRRHKPVLHLLALVVAYNVDANLGAPKRDSPPEAAACACHERDGVLQISRLFVLSNSGYIEATRAR